MNDERKVLKAGRNVTQENRKNYNKSTRDIKIKVKDCKEKWFEEKREITETSTKNQNFRLLFKTANEICGIFGPKLNAVKDKNDRKR